MVHQWHGGGAGEETIDLCKAIDVAPGVMGLTPTVVVGDGDRELGMAWGEIGRRMHHEFGSFAVFAVFLVGHVRPDFYPEGWLPDTAARE